MTPIIVALFDSVLPLLVMALTMMFGLAVGAVQMMVLVPVFYATLYRIKSPAG
jgi:hypothetical protein